MTLVKFNNNNGSRSLLPGFNDVFESIFNDTFFSERVPGSLPAVNSSESADFYHVEMAAPGLKKECFKINVEGQILNISYQDNEEHSSEGKRYTRREYSFTSFFRSFNLPEQADLNIIEASYENGILKLDIGKREEAKSTSRQIELK
jgi:HSP20 family protein